MCPLRYIVFALSALVALIALVYSRGEVEDEFDELEPLEGDADADADGKEQALLSRPAPRKTSVVDFFTGRYLMTKYRQWSGRRVLSAGL